MYGEPEERAGGRGVLILARLGWQCTARMIDTRIRYDDCKGKIIDPYKRLITISRLTVFEFGSSWSLGCTVFFHCTSVMWDYEGDKHVNSNEGHGFAYINCIRLCLGSDRKKLNACRIRVKLS